MTEETKARFPGQVDQVYPAPFLTIPPQPTEKKPGQLTEAQVKQFFEEGYVVVNNFFDTQKDLDPCREAISLMVDQLADKLYDAGKIKDKYEDYGLFQRLTKLEEEHTGSNILLFKSQKMPKAFCDVWSNERLVNVVEQLLGPDIAGHPVWNLRTKTPKSNAVSIPWHQDSAYFNQKSYDHMIVTAWIPFIDAVPENGCMQVVKEAHRKGKVANHTCCRGDTWYVMLEEDEMERSLGVDMQKDMVTCPVEYGGFLLFHNITPHRSLENLSSDVRWSVDLRWQSPYKDWGFYDLGEGVAMRSADEPNMKPDFKKFFSFDRKEQWQKRYYRQEDANDPFDTTITGPWIGQWETVNHNKHTEAFAPFR